MFVHERGIMYLDMISLFYTSLSQEGSSFYVSCLLQQATDNYWNLVGYEELRKGTAEYQIC